MIGAYELGLDYAKQRQQFGRPIATFQMVQDLLVKSLGNITSSWGMVVQLARLQDAEIYRDEHSSLAKAVFILRWFRPGERGRGRGPCCCSPARAPTRSMRGYSAAHAGRPRWQSSVALSRRTGPPALAS